MLSDCSMMQTISAARQLGFGPWLRPEGYCALHAVHMELRNNASGSWYSHLETDEAGDYFCKGKGRPRSNGR